MTALKLNQPLVVLPATSQDEVRRVQALLVKYGAQTRIETLAEGDGYPFWLTAGALRTLNKEIKKAARSKTNLTLLLASFKPLGEGRGLSCLVRGIDWRLEDMLRESDTVLALDDDRLAVLGFTTDALGADTMRQRVAEKLEAVFQSDLEVTSGYAVFPDEGQSLAELLRLAESRRVEMGPDSIGAARPSGGETYSRKEEANHDSGFIPLVFKHARGRQVQKLVELPPEVVWAGLSRLELEDQKNFFFRLENGSALAKYLAPRISAREKPPAEVNPVREITGVIEPSIFQRQLSVRQKHEADVWNRLENVQSIPTLPEVALQVFETASSPDLLVNEVADLVAGDPALSAKLLKVVNSPFYGYSTKIHDPRQAVVFLGLDDVVDLTLGLATASVFEASNVSQLYNPRYIWHHSVCTSLLVKNLAQRGDGSQRSRLFTTGLLHDIGKIYFADNYLDQYRDMIENAARFNVPAFEIELEVLGVSHAQVGEAICRQWNYPPFVAAVIGSHHTPQDNADVAATCALVGLADFLYCSVIDEIDGLDDRPVFVPYMSVGHWRTLARYWPSLRKTPMSRMIKWAKKIIAENGDRIMDVFG